jgi:hypothetical protein
MIRRAVLLLVLIAGLHLQLGCDDDPEPRVWFPLAPGTRWDYGAFADTVLGSVRIDGHTYLRPSGGSLVTSSPVRLTPDDRLVFWNGESEQTLFDFSVPVGTSWVMRIGEFDLVVTVENRDLPNVVVPAGTFNGCFYFSVKRPGVLDGDLWFVVAPGTGVLIKTYAWGRFELQAVHLGP